MLRPPSDTARGDNGSPDRTTRNPAGQTEPLSPPPPSNTNSGNDSSPNLPGNVPGPLPAHIQQAMADHFQALFQHFTRQLPLHNNAIVPGNTSAPPHTHQPDNTQHDGSQSSQHQRVQQPHLHLSFNRIAQQERIGAAAGLRSSGNSHDQPHTESNSPPEPPLATPGNISAPSDSSGSGRIAGQPDRLPSVNARSGHSQQSLVEENLSAIESALANSNAPHESVFQTLRTQLQTLRDDGDTSTETLKSLATRLELVSARTDELRARVDDAIARVLAGNPSTSTPPSPIPSATANRNVSNAVYLLSSPSGPHALLVSPSGLYTAPWQFPILSDRTATPIAHHTPNPFPSATAFTQTRRMPIENPAEPSHATSSLNMRTPQQQPAQPPIQPQPEQPHQQPPVQQEQREQVNQVGELARALLPLGGHIWLLVRLFGFVYFFTGGGGHVRGIILGVCALMVFVAQTGVFRPFLQSIWDPLRRHVENILPLAANDRPLVAQGNNAGNDANALRDQAVAGGNVVPTPHQAAERLLRERDQRDEGIFRQNLRRLERALALFVASLVPGVGERHIAARDAAEAARRREVERLREENARREEEERAKAERGDDERGNENAAPEPATNPHGQDHAVT